VAPKVFKSRLISKAYQGYLGQLVPEHYLETMDLPEGSTWSDAIAQQVLKRSVGLVTEDNICFQAITELRETTEGKTPERQVVGGNEELLALAHAIANGPASTESESESESEVEGSNFIEGEATPES
jgi:hypothetical protein